MRTGRKALLLTTAAAASALAVASGTWASAPSMPPDTGYIWAQPDASLVGVTNAEPTRTWSARSMLPDAGYVWAQPDATRTWSTRSMLSDTGYVWAQPDASLVGVTSGEPVVR